MPTTPRSHRKLEYRARRLKLTPQREPYWEKIAQGLYVGYYRPDSTWWTRKLVPGTKKYTKAALGAADDHRPADSLEVFDYFQAVERARGLASEHARRDHGARLKPATVADAAAAYMIWFETARKSVNETKSTIEAHILPELGPIALADLRAARLRQWLDRLAKTPPRRRVAAGKSPQHRPPPTSEDGLRARRATANRIFNVLRAILNHAFEHGLVADDTEWRRVKAFARADEPVTRFLTDAEARRLINASRKDLRALVTAALFTGARFSELAAACVADFNPETAQLYIRPGKSGKGRHVPLNNQGRAFFEGQTAGRPGEAPILTRADGKPWGKNQYKRLLAEACKAAKIEPAITLHDLRHSYASLLAQSGADLLTISRLLGHADTRVTSRHYAHLCDTTLSNAVRAHLPGFGHTEKRNISAIERRKKRA